MFVTSDAAGDGETVDEDAVNELDDEDMREGDEDTFDIVAPAPCTVAGGAVELGGPIGSPVTLAEGPVNPLLLVPDAVPRDEEVLPPDTVVVAGAPPPLLLLVAELLPNGFLPVEAGSID